MRKTWLWIALVTLGFVGTMNDATRAAPERDRNPGPVPQRGLDEVNAEARRRFLEVERFARLPETRQAKELPDFYRQFAQRHLNPMFVGVLSVYPENLLDRRKIAAPAGDYQQRWSKQLQSAALQLSAEQVADNLAIRLWLDVASHVRTVQVLAQNRPATSMLIEGDLDSNDLAAAERACAAISVLRLSEFSDKLLALHLADSPSSKPAYNALGWLGDPSIVRPLLADIEKNPKAIIRHAGLFQGPLCGKPAEPALTKLLESSDANIRYHAAYALLECRDATLAPAIAKLVKEPDPRTQSAALDLARNLPNEAYFAIVPDLVPLLSAEKLPIRVRAVRCFAQHGDRRAGPALLTLLKLNSLDSGLAVEVMHSLRTLTDSTFGYDLHQWGPAANGEAITKFESWLREQAKLDAPRD